MPRILIVDDDREMCDMVRRLLDSDDYEVDAAFSIEEALRAVSVAVPDLVLLDVVLGAEDGRDLLHEIRLIDDVAIVFLTAKGSEGDRIAGLRMGADDYIVKPFSPGELAARIDSVMRRVSRQRRDGSRRPILHFGDLQIDEIGREVRVGTTSVALTAKEFDLLAFLARSPREVFSRTQLLERVWDSSSEWQDEATVTEHVRRVRQKIEADPNHPRHITTVRGIGYRFEPS